MQPGWVGRNALNANKFDGGINVLRVYVVNVIGFFEFVWEFFVWIQPMVLGCD